MLLGSAFGTSFDLIHRVQVRWDAAEMSTRAGSVPGMQTGIEIARGTGPERTGPDLIAIGTGIVMLRTTVANPTAAGIIGVFSYPLILINDGVQLKV